MSEFDERSVAELLAMDFTTIEAKCGSCGKVTDVYLQYLLNRRAVAVSTLLRDIAPRLRCNRCNVPPSRVRPDSVRVPPPSGGGYIMPPISETKKDPATDP